jgi:hypothetical protein
MNSRGDAEGAEKRRFEYTSAICVMGVSAGEASLLERS